MLKSIFALDYPAIADNRSLRSPLAGSFETWRLRTGGCFEKEIKKNLFEAPGVFYDDVPQERMHKNAGTVFGAATKARAEHIAKRRFVLKKKLRRISSKLPVFFMMMFLRNECIKMQGPFLAQQQKRGQNTLQNGELF